jgi:hypothetical protein
MQAMNQGDSPCSAAPRRRGFIGFLLALLSLVGLRAELPRPTRMVERDGWFLNDTDR